MPGHSVHTRGSKEVLCKAVHPWPGIREGSEEELTLEVIVDDEEI
jgi:hypothetical protein